MVRKALGIQNQSLLQGTVPITISARNQINTNSTPTLLSTDKHGFSSNLHCVQEKKVNP